MRHLLRRVTVGMASLLALGLALKAASPVAEASYGLINALETVGIATGIGTTLGLSTIAFYDKPTSHMSNALIGAGAGMLVGLGVAAYLMATSPDEDEISPEELLIPEKKPVDEGKKPEKNPTKTDPKKKGARLSPRHQLYASVPVALGNVLPGEWAVAMRVLELRF